MGDVTAAVTLATMDGELVGWMGLLGFILSWVLIVNLRRILEVRSREKTRREVAAYLAAGVLDVDQARVVLGRDAGAPNRDPHVRVAAATVPPIAAGVGAVA